MKLIYFCDIMSDEDEQQKELVAIQESLDRILAEKAEVELVDRPPFGHVDFDILFFDYGGMNLPGNSLFEHMSNYLLKDAENHPSRIYVITSEMTWDYMREARLEFEGKLHNVFCASSWDPKTLDNMMREALLHSGLKYA